MPNRFDLRCPQCHKDDKIEILAKAWVRITPIGTDASLTSTLDHQWHGTSQCRCGHCGFDRYVVYFEKQNQKNRVLDHTEDTSPVVSLAAEMTEPLVLP